MLQEKRLTARMGVAQSTSEVGDLGEVIRTRKPRPLPVVMEREEVQAVNDGSSVFRVLYLIHAKADDVCSARRAETR